MAWNGPMGIFEIPQFSSGTRSIATVLAGLDAITVIGGGSTAEAVTQVGLARRDDARLYRRRGLAPVSLRKDSPGIAVLADKR